jgi:hypothetical protein
MKKKNFKSKIILSKNIGNLVGKSENCFGRIIKNILFEDKKFQLKLILIENFQIFFEKT